MSRAANTREELVYKKDNCQVVYDFTEKCYTLTIDGIGEYKYNTFEMAYQVMNWEKIIDDILKGVDHAKRNNN